MKTTDDWEALLDGTTPGPWEVVKCHATWKQASPEENALIPERRREFTATLATPVDGADIVATSDTYLIAAAPEAVAEVVRLRRALEQQLAYITDELEAEGVETHDDIDGTWPSMQRYGELSELLGQRDFLTRILEGHTDG